MHKIPVLSLGWEEPLEKETAAHSSILAWKVPWAEEPGGLQSVSSKRVGRDLVAKQLNATEKEKEGGREGKKGGSDPT